MSRFDLSIGDFVARTGVAEPTLRMWERRHGFPLPQRTRSGHRRYSEQQVELVERMLAAREAGLSLPAAIARAQAPPDLDAVSLFSTLRRLRPDLEPRAVHKPVLVALSRAIEDETLARADARLIFGCFQRESFYRRSRARWRELTRAAHATAVFADFSGPSDSDTGPAEVPIGARQQIAREWAIVIHGGRSSICMVGRETASSNVEASSSERSFELLWAVEAEAVETLTRLCVALTRPHLPTLADRAEEELASVPLETGLEQARLTMAVLNRTLAELS